MKEPLVAGSAGTMRWPAGPLVSVALGLCFLALPARLEGPELLMVGRGHALSFLDLIGAVPLTIGAVWLEIGLWRRRAALAQWARGRPGVAAMVWLAAGLGLGLLIASAFSRFFWWWAVGAIVLAGAGAGLLATARERGDDGRT